MNYFLFVLGLVIFLINIYYTIADVQIINTFTPLTNSLYLCNNTLNTCQQVNPTSYPSSWNITYFNPNSVNCTLLACNGNLRYGVWPMISQNAQYEGVVAQLPRVTVNSALSFGTNVNGFSSSSTPTQIQGNTESIVLIWQAGTVSQFTYMWYSSNTLTWFPDPYLVYSKWNSGLNIFQGIWNFPIQSNSLRQSVSGHVPVLSNNTILSYPNTTTQSYSTGIIQTWTSPGTMFPFETLYLQSVPIRLPASTSLIYDLHLDSKWFLNTLTLSSNNSVFNFPFWKSIYSPTVGNNNNTNQFIQSFTQACYYQLGIDGVIVNTNLALATWKFDVTFYNAISPPLWIGTMNMTTTNPQVYTFYNITTNPIQSQTNCLIVTTMQQVEQAVILQGCILYNNVMIPSTNNQSVLNLLEWRYTKGSPYYPTRTEDITQLSVNSSLWWDLLPFDYFTSSLYFTRLEWQQSVLPTITNSWSFNDKNASWAVFTNSTIPVTTLFYGPPFSQIVWDVNGGSTCTCIQNCYTSFNIIANITQRNIRTLWSCAWSSPFSIFHFQSTFFLPQTVTNTSLGLFEWTYSNGQWWILSKLQNSLASFSCPIEYTSTSACTQLRSGSYILETSPSYNSNYNYVFLYPDSGYSSVELIINNNNLFNLQLQTSSSTWKLQIPFSTLFFINNNNNNNNIPYWYNVTSNNGQSQIVYEYNNPAWSLLPVSIFSNYNGFIQSEYIHWMMRLPTPTPVQHKLLLNIPTSNTNSLSYTQLYKSWNTGSVLMQPSTIDTLSNWIFISPTGLPYITITNEIFVVMGDVLQMQSLNMLFTLVVPNNDSLPLLTHSFGIQNYKVLGKNYTTSTHYPMENFNVSTDNTFDQALENNIPFQVNNNTNNWIQDSATTLYPLLLPGTPEINYQPYSNFTTNWLNCYGNSSQSCQGDSIIMSQNDGNRFSSFRYFSTNQTQQVIYTLVNRSPTQALYVSVYLQNNVYINLVPTYSNTNNYSCQTLSYTCIIGYINTYTCFLQPQSIALYISPISQSYSSTVFSSSQQAFIPSNYITTINSCTAPFSTPSSSSSSLYSSSSSSSSSYSSSLSSTGVSSSSSFTHAASSSLSSTSSSSHTSSSSTGILLVNNTDPWTYMNISIPTQDPTPKLTDLQFGMIVFSTMSAGCLLGLFVFVL